MSMAPLHRDWSDSRGERRARSHSAAAGAGDDAIRAGVVKRIAVQPVDHRGVPLSREPLAPFVGPAGEHADAAPSISRKRWREWFHREQSTYWITRRLFLRAIGVVYFIAFWSLGRQVLGLMGKDGITPAVEALQRFHKISGNTANWRVPTLCWLNCSDFFLQFLCWGGMALAALLFLGLIPIPVLFLLWAFYLSLTNAGGIFMGYQWDALLLEVGFLAMLFAPWGWRLRSPRAAPPSRIVLFLIQWLLFRLMFLSGVVKLTSGDPCWPQLSALNYHYETQPLPTWIGWYAHNMPAGFNALSTAIMFTVELVVPFLIFGTRRLRAVACGALVALMTLIGLTGNYNFFDVLAAVMSISLLDDRAWGHVIRRGWRVMPVLRESRINWGRWLRVVSFAPIAVIIVFLSVHTAWSSLRLRTQVTKTDGLVARAWSASYDALDRAASPVHDFLEDKGILKKLNDLHGFHFVSPYGLFRVMTKERKEIVIEGSDDGWTWKEFEFPWKPGDVVRAPGFCEPHQPRLDWQMWFAALGPKEHSPWFMGLMQRILEGSPEVLALFDKNPFPTAAPRFVRAKLYDYHFTDPPARAATGAWWRREYVGLYCPPVSNGK
ncbi:MAG: lipase maturation factor family protein [Planctomycetes bacterium]|nr:lipase maturation factor family protein [Planctomycetota bacterium]